MSIFALFPAAFKYTQGFLFFKTFPWPAFPSSLFSIDPFHRQHFRRVVYSYSEYLTVPTHSYSWTSEWLVLFSFPTRSFPSIFTHTAVLKSECSRAPSLTLDNVHIPKCSTQGSHAVASVSLCIHWNLGPWSTPATVWRKPIAGQGCVPSWPLQPSVWIFASHFALVNWEYLI